MYGSLIVSGILLLLSVGTPATGEETAIVSLSVVAPIQKDSPVQVTDLHYGEGHITLTLVNNSDKPAIGVAIAGLEVVPPKCASEQGRVIDVGGYTKPFQIAPHGKILTHATGEPIFPVAMLVSDARRRGAVLLHFQIGVVEVDFADGSEWRPHEELPHAPFDPSLVDADTKVCAKFDGAAAPSTAAAVKTLATPINVTFDHAVGKPLYEHDEGMGGAPHLFLQCRLGGLKATCPLP